MNKIIYLSVVGLLIVGFGFVTGLSLNSSPVPLGVPTPSTVSSSTSINSLYAEVNRLVNFVSTSTSPLGAISALSSSTGNLIVGSSSNWIALTVGANGRILTASSTAQGGVSWELSSASAFSTSSAHSWLNLQTFNGGISFSTATGTSPTSTLTIGELFATTSTIQTAIISVVASSTAGINYGLFSTQTLNVTSTSVFAGYTFTNATGTGNFQVGTFTSTGLSTINSLNVTNANEYRTRSASIVIANPDRTAITHSSTSLAFGFDVPATLFSVSCYSRPSGTTSTIQLNRRVAETPATSGSDMLSATLTCGTSIASTTSFSVSTTTGGQRIHIELITVAGQPSSTSIFVRATNDD